MISQNTIIICTALYLAILFYIAYRGDKPSANEYSRYQPLIYTLSITIYCTSWTYFGAVGNAAISGWDYFSIYLGPIVIFLFFTPFLRKLIAVSKRQKTTTIADFIATRYGKSHRVAAIVTMIALIGTLPYISLQIKAVVGAYNKLTGPALAADSTAWLPDTAFVLSIILAVFAILFGARTIDASEHHRGMIRAIAFESVVKLVAFCIIAILALQIIFDISTNISSAPDPITIMLSPFQQWELSSSFFTRTLLAATAIVLLPRQFHVMAVEGKGDEINTARWGFPLYLLIFSLAVIPIVAAGIQMSEGPENADFFILSLPMQQGNTVLAIISYIGGFSAATGMVIVAAITLSTMVSNDLIFPLILRYLKTEPGQDFSRILLLIRRTTILALLMLAYGYYHISASNIPLYSIGLLSFAAAVQFMPAIIGGLYWKQGHRNGAFWGLSAGFVIWLYTLLLPSLVNFPLMPEDFVRHGFLGQAWLSPNALFGSSFNDYLTHGVFWSLLFNITFYVGISLRSQANFTDRLQASSYVDQTENLFEHTTTSKADFRMQDLYELCSRFTGEDRTTRFFLEHDYDMTHAHSILADQNSIKLAEHLLASSIGSASAEQLIRTAVSSNTSNQELFHLLGTTGEALQFNREILQVAIDNINQGVSVVDRDLCITAWNRTYIELFDYPDGFLHVGKPIEDIIRFNAERGLGAMSTTQHEDEVNKRMNYLRHGEPYTFVRYWQDGRVIQTRGARMPDGGFITTFTDITELKQAEKELEAINLNLERKVEQRTEMLSTVNKELQQAKHLAEDATRSKTHFLAAASHDLTQPLGAAKLYMGALLEDVSGDKSKEDITRNALSALQTAESLLKSLLDISKLESGALKPETTRFPIWQLFQSIQTEFSVLAKEKNLNLRIVSSQCGTETDKTLLRSILQNFLTNAIRYTESGSIMVLCRRSGENHVRIEVRDSGSGIPADKIEDIFMEFKQLNPGFNEGAGLGLAICKHAAHLLGLELKVASRVGEGSTFSITVPRVNVEETTSPIIDNRHYGKRWLEGIRILCVDDDQSILGATRTLLDRWGASTACVDQPDYFYELIREDANFDVILMDYQLHADSNGLELLELYREISNRDFLGILVTAEQDQALRERTIAEGYLFLEKPVEPARLRSVLRTAFMLQRQEVEDSAP